jgi:hypothetical protein
MFFSHPRIIVGMYPGSIEMRVPHLYLQDHLKRASLENIIWFRISRMTAFSP